ncbi:uncharacterized protein LOC123874228 [Maniola jurtina]|uniref:uncharacterized protein LOC123874228 n=1 Tax=Maniola jurtina TaxID=191418 RepID=UPI001E68A1E6|nr:uncharacterized protein LOC123874228 [Maniola jurtina]
MLDYDIVACIASVVLYVIIHKKNRKIKRRYWVRPSLRNRPNVSPILEDFRRDDINRRNIRSKFNTFLRISSEEFEILLNLTGPMISKTDTRWRNAVSASDRLAITLRYLATGDSYFSLGTLFKVSPQVISLIILDVCQTLVSTLSNYLRMPNTHGEWLSVARSFMQKWNVPNCVGALDGKHIRILCPTNSGSEFFNYKSYFSIVLLALIDANYNFLYVDIGCQGRISDGGVLRNSTLFDMIRDGTLSLPQAIPLQGRNTPVPFYFIGDDAFPISQNIIKPFFGYHAKGSPERVFNYRLSRGRMVVEDAFGILSNKFRILHSRIGLQNEKAKIVVMACVHLHNFMKRNERTTDGVLNEMQQNIPQIALNVEPSVIRNELKCYFLSEQGQLPWQYQI